MLGLAAGAGAADSAVYGRGGGGTAAVAGAGGGGGRDAIAGAGGSVSAFGLSLSSGLRVEVAGFFSGSGFLTSASGTDAFAWATFVLSDLASILSNLTSVLSVLTASFLTVSTLTSGVFEASGLPHDWCQSVGGAVSTTGLLATTGSATGLLATAGALS